MVTTIVFESVMERHEYKRIAHRWGGTFYFRMARPSRRRSTSVKP